MLVESGHIYDIDHDGENTLTIVFNDQSKYEYFNVSQGLFQEFMAAPSKSTFFRQNIKGVFAFQRIA